jgi:hypothetical protein
LLAAAAGANASDAHKSDSHLKDPAAALYERSPFAHGYIHGYEDGYHAADQDLQFGRLGRGVRTKPAPHPENRIHSGDPASLRRGYEQGFAAGYRDSAAGREFRAIAALRSLAAVLPAGAPTLDRAFDHGFNDGYFAAEAYVAKSSRPINDFGYISAFCAEHLYRGKKSEAKASQCPGYTAGFRLGYADARLEKPPQTTASAK